MHLSTQKYIPILWLWMTALLLSTIGISVQQIYCYCVGETMFSLGVGTESPCVRVLPKSESCCKKVTQPSCCSKETVQDEAAPCCSKKPVKIFQLNAKYTVGQPLYKKFNCPLWADELPAFLRLYRPVICDASLSNKVPPDLPPRSGRDRCVRHAFFRL
jgi:hypothetical protein